MIETLVLVVHVTVALALVIIVLFQHGSKGAAMGSAFGGSSQTLFGSRGPATAMAKITTVAAVIFMLTSITLSVLSSQGTQDSVVSDVQTQAAELPTTLPDQPQVGPSAPISPAGPTSQAEAPTGPIGPVDKAPATDGPAGKQ